MGEVREENKDTISSIAIFVCYAREDEEYRQRLEKHLSLFQREGLIYVWHNGKIRPGEEWEQIIHTQLNTAQIVLLLISPDFIASDYCYSVEMKQALERHAQREVHVIPVIVRPIGWEKTPLGKLQALPKNARPIALWRNRDAAFFDVEEGIRSVIEEVKAQSPLFTPSHQLQEKSEKDLQEASVMEKVSSPEVLIARHETHQESTGSTSSEDLFQVPISHPSTAVEDDTPPLDEYVSPLRSKKTRKRGLLVSATILLVLAVFLAPFLPLPTCPFAACHSSSQPTKQPSLQHDGEIRDQNLSMELVAVVSPSFKLPDAPKHFLGDITPPTDTSAVLLPPNTSTYDTIIINIQNLRYGGSDILIDYLALKLLSIPELPQPLRVWTPGVATTYLGYSYPVTYTGQTSGQLLYAKPPKKVTLTPAGPDHAGETDPLLIQVMSTITAYLQFRVEITYDILGVSQTLILPHIFHVVFSDASNWHEYILQNGSLIEKP